MNWNNNDYEVAVLGTGLAGLIAATFLAKKKHRVLVLKEAGYEPSFSRGGYRFVPFSSFSEKRLKLPLLHRVAQSLGVSLLSSRREGGTPQRKNHEKQKVLFQVVLPESRVDLFCDRSLLGAEWKREFPKELPGIMDFHAEIDRLRQLLEKEKTGENPQQFFPLRSRSWIRRLLPVDGLPKTATAERLSSFSKEFREMIRLQMISFGNLHSEQFPVSLASYLLPHDEAVEWFTSGDLGTLEENILDRFIQHKGRIGEIEKIEKTHLERKNGFTLSLGNGERVIRAEHIIVNAPLDHLTTLSGQWEKILSKWRRRVRPRYVLVPFFVGIREKAVPVGMKELLVSVREIERSHEGGNLLLLNLSSPGDESEAPEGRRALTVVSAMPIGEWDEDFFAEQEKLVRDHLDHLFPFMDRHIEFFDSEWTRTQISRWSYPHYLYEAPSGFDWREGLVPPRLAQNLYFTGRENFPYLGAEGEILSGLIVANHISKKYPDPSMNF
jgi:phytoene dehydrogenase-like protein